MKLHHKNIYVWDSVIRQITLSDKLSETCETESLSIRNKSMSLIKSFVTQAFKTSHLSYETGKALFY